MKRGRARRSANQGRADDPKETAPPSSLQPGSAGRTKADTPNRLPPLRLAFLLTLLLAGFLLLPRVTADPWLAGSFVGAAAALLLIQLVLRRHVARTGRVLAYEFMPARVHWVQATMQSCIYVYWGWYWRNVYDFAPLIIAQLLFAYALDMLVTWSRRDKWILGFGPFPIILSTNLFLWFKDEWFFLQFAMVALGVLGKEFIRWTRDGRLTHIFNPSALPLTVFSLGLIVTNSTHISWGEQIATTITHPPKIYLEIFLVGLVVQALFSVTLVTLSAATSLYALNLLYTGATGVYFFVDTNIPVAVFLGLHLLVTDPATSPRTIAGKIAFGGMYGAGVFGLYSVLGWLGVPTFYDKLLVVPPLNLSVRILDRASGTVGAWLRAPAAVPKWSPRQVNLAFMAVWVLVFGTMMATGFLSIGKAHPGGDPAFWRRACEDGRANGCQTWVRVLGVMCQRNSVAACDTRGRLLDEGRVVPRDLLKAGKSFWSACDLGFIGGCTRLRDLMLANGPDVFLRECNAGAGSSCFILGALHKTGAGVARDASRAVGLFKQACAHGLPRGCEQLGENYLRGEGTAADPAKAIESFEKACQDRHAASCYRVAVIYRRGIGGETNETLARRRFRRACDLGFPEACQPARQP